MTAALSNYLARQGLAVTVVTLHPSTKDFFAVDESVERLGLDLVASRSMLDKVVVNLKRVWRLRALLRRERPDILVGVMTPCAILSILVALGSPTRVITAERNYPGRKRLFLPWVLLRKTTYRFAAAHIVQSREAAAWLKRHTTASEVHIIPNAVAWPLPCHAPVIEPDSCPVNGAQCVLAVGTKVQQKGFDLLLQAFARVADSFPDWRLVILGVSPESEEATGAEQSLGAEIRELGLEARVCLPGLAGNMSDWYERADIFVLSSRYEGFPNVLLEAMAAGCACIAFDCDTGPRDILEHDENGLLAPPEDVSRLAAGMERLMADADLRERLGSAAKSVRERFSEQRVLGHWHQVIEHLLDRRPAYGPT